MADFVEPPIEFLDLTDARSVTHAKELVSRQVAGELPLFVIRAEGEVAAARQSQGESALYGELFSHALGATAVKGDIEYNPTGAGQFGAHVDEEPEILLGLAKLGRFNAHTVVVGSVTVAAVYTRPGYYEQGASSRIPLTYFNDGIGYDIRYRSRINPHTTEAQVHRGLLDTGDTAVFFERTAPDVDGPPNVVHMFYGGTRDRSSQVIQFAAQAS